TTSKTHTALKVEPMYDGPVIHVLDASRSVAVVSSLLSKEPGVAENFNQASRKEFETIRVQRANRRSTKSFISLEAARKNKWHYDWDNYVPAVPLKMGIKVYDNYNLEELTDYIDWTPFFSSWQLAGKFPDILQDPIVGVEAQKLYNDARSLLRRIIDENWLTAKAVVGIFEANSTTDDDVVLHGVGTKSSDVNLHFLRQQIEKAPGLPNFCLSDFVMPYATGRKDYFGAFAVTAGIGIEEHVAAFEKAHDDYNAIMLKALADRLAETMAEKMHEIFRKQIWGYAKDEVLSSTEIIAEKYKGIRPAPGYPACPEHTEKGTLFQLLDVEKNIGIKLTESYAMYPAASVSGWYLGHPESKYFGLGDISKDQIEDYAYRKNMTVIEVEKWLSPLLNYNT
ncbi:MAG TPA: vitamin B12 dependent-methionine synthase activation domain-containing protein, partial [Saprospiraceae bacterium]|nr:vitamin B12 dependent-methionine synthase activation domain-containing protein [Saprospiraceae bacterium]